MSSTFEDLEVDHLTKINENEETIVSLGFRRHDYKPVILKALRDEYPKPKDIAMLHRVSFT